MCSAYNLARNIKKWPMVILFSMLNIAGVNSHIIFLGNKNEALPRRFFLRRLGKQLLQKHLQRRTTITCLPQKITSRVKEILGKTDPPNTGENSVSNNSSRLAQVRKRCFSCQKEKKTRLTRYSCHTYQKYLSCTLCIHIPRWMQHK